MARVCAVFFFAAAITVGIGAEKNPAVLYVQMVRATDEEKPAQAHWKPIGPKLSKRISPVFRWKNYWEVNRHTVVIGDKTVPRLHLTRVRDLEIQSKPGDEFEIRLYHNGKLSRKAQHAAKQRMTIMGGQEDDGDGWFVVIRREEPQ